MQHAAEVNGPPRLKSANRTPPPHACRASCLLFSRCPTRPSAAYTYASAYSLTHSRLREQANDGPARASVNPRSIRQSCDIRCGTQCSAIGHVCWLAGPQSIPLCTLRAIPTFRYHHNFSAFSSFWRSAMPRACLERHTST